MTTTYIKEKNPRVAFADERPVPPELMGRLQPASRLLCPLPPPTPDSSASSSARLARFVFVFISCICICFHQNLLLLSGARAPDSDYLYM